jgi:hypothetical protein
MDGRLILMVVVAAAAAAAVVVVVVVVVVVEVVIAAVVVTGLPMRRALRIVLFCFKCLHNVTISDMDDHKKLINVVCKRRPLYDMRKNKNLLQQGSLENVVKLSCFVNGKNK